MDDREGDEEPEDAFVASMASLAADSLVSNARQSRASCNDFLSPHALVAQTLEFFMGRWVYCE